MRRKESITQWLKERIYSILDEVIAGLIILGLGYLVGTLSGILPSISLHWLGGISLTLVVAIALVVVLVTVGFVLWRRRRRKVIKLPQPVITVPKDFVGREEEIAWFQEMLQGKTAERVMSIYGAPGIGKSWLVNRLAKECQDTGVAWATIDFREAAYDPLTLLDAIQRQLGEKYFVSFDDKLQEYIEFRAQQQREYPSLDGIRVLLLQKKEDEAVNEFMRCLEQLVKGKKAVLLFDTFEKVEDAEPANFLQKRLLIGMKDGGLPNLMAVVAGWNKLTWRDGWERVISPHELKYFSIEEIKRRLAIEMGVDTEAVNVVLAAAILDYTKRHPLCVGLAATLIAESVRRGERVSKEMFVAHKEELDERMISELLVERILKRLDENLAETIRLCAIPRWFDAGMIRALKGIEDGSHALLERIAKYCSFVRRHSPSGYEYHEIVRQLFLDKWKRDDLNKYIELNEQAARFYEGRLQRIEQLGDSFNEEWQQLTLERVYHRSKIDEDKGIALTCGIFEKADRLYQANFCEALINEVKGHLVKERNQLRMSYYEGRLASRRNKWQDALKIYEALIECSDLDLALKANVVDSLGYAYSAIGNLDKAISMYILSLKIKQEISDEYGAGYTLSMLGESYTLRGNLNEAIKCFGESLRIHQKFGNEYGAMQTLRNMELAYIFQGRWNEVIKCHNQIREIINKLKSELGGGNGVEDDPLCLGLAYMFQGKYEKANECFQQSLKVAQERNDQRGVGIALYNIGEIYRLRGQFDEALNCLRQSREIFSKVGTTLLAGVALKALGTLLYDQVRIDEAAKYYEESLRILRETGGEYELGCTLSRVGEVYMAKGEWDKAYDAYIHSLNIARKLEGYYTKVEALIGLCKLSHVQRLYDKIATYAKEAEEIAIRYSYFDLLAELKWIQGDLFFDKGNCNDAFTSYAESCINALKYNYHLFIRKMDQLIKWLYKLTNDEKVIMIPTLQLFASFLQKQGLDEQASLFIKLFEEVEELRRFSNGSVNYNS